MPNKDSGQPGHLANLSSHKLQSCLLVSCLSVICRASYARPDNVLRVYRYIIGSVLECFELLCDCAVNSEIFVRIIFSLKIFSLNDMFTVCDVKNSQLEQDLPTPVNGIAYDITLGFYFC